MATKYEYYSSGDDANQAFYLTIGWEAQTFTPSTSHIISSVKVKLLRYAGSVPGTLTAEIWATDANAKPTGGALVSGTYAGGNDITTVSPGEWVDITLSTTYLLLAETVYALVMKSSTNDPTKPIYWRRDSDVGPNPTYTGGSKAASADQGTSWSLDTSNDFMFEEWGEPQGSGEGGGGSIFPLDSVARVSSIRHIFQPGMFRMQVALGDIGFDIDVAESSVRSALDTAKEVVEPPADLPVTKPPAPTTVAPPAPPPPTKYPDVLPFGGKLPTSTPVQEPTMPSRIPGIEFEPEYIGRSRMDKLLDTIKRISPFGGK